MGLEQWAGARVGSMQRKRKGGAVGGEEGDGAQQTAVSGQMKIGFKKVLLEGLEVIIIWMIIKSKCST